MTETFLDSLRDELDADRLITDPDILVTYASDRADLVEGRPPLVVVRARSENDVVATLRWASARGIAVIPRGAGSGLSGGVAPDRDAIVLSLEQMTALHIDPVDRLAVAEPGVVNADVGRAAAVHGLFYPPDPGSFEISTIGGNVATNAGGLRCVRYGVTRQSVAGLRVVLADGRVLTTGGRTIKDVAGYDLTGLIVGSEGTLGVVTQATLRLQAAPAPQRTVVGQFDDLAGVGRAVQSIAGSGIRPTILELLDRMTINCVEDFRPAGLDRSCAALLIAQVDPGPGLAEGLVDLLESAGASLALASDDAFEAEALIGTRRIAGEAVMARGPSIIEDVCVPVSRLAELLQRIQEASAEAGIAVATVGHAGDGNVHPILSLASSDAEEIERAHVLARRIASIAVDLGGTITGEHGVGRLKREWLRNQLDPVSLDVHRAIKAALDPAGILNPGTGF
ncbi:FAD-linked oxidase C-terminal domain-containing protein [Dactylosporangium sp. AC04546]|uniref:FAD-binding oxidoreductase n=1 Tax=Dactylosporangium sp. AC04546 TaxID=2862460 RepID=UPI001EE10DC1|nr:FAD-linked oxidase C-terminal domain-containing protein [Dactylosporangium sp. AC04546]WVK86840.1 FAD-linked oxidase C-terminal domain-containing protein [Dactylosporangium sp. AC04546]